MPTGQRWNKSIKAPDASICIYQSTIYS